MSIKPNRATIHLHGSLLDFTGLDATADIKVRFNLQPSVKDLIEAQGIPHTEVYGIEIDGDPVSFDEPVGDGADIDIHPAETADRSHFEKLSKHPEEQPRRFVADIHLGKLARYLRLLGLDTRYSNSYDDRELIKIATGSKRLLLTRDIELLKYGILKYGYWVRNTAPEEQVREVVLQFDLDEHIQPFSRCLECNGKLESSLLL